MSPPVWPPAIERRAHRVRRISGREAFSGQQEQEPERVLARDLAGRAGAHVGRPGRGRPPPGGRGTMPWHEPHAAASVRPTPLHRRGSARPSPARAAAASGASVRTCSAVGVDNPLLGRAGDRSASRATARKFDRSARASPSLSPARGRRCTRHRCGRGPSRAIAAPGAHEVGGPTRPAGAEALAGSG